MWRVALLCAVLGCGRSHFDEVVASDATDAISSDAMPDVWVCSASYHIAENV